MTQASIAYLEQRYIVLEKEIANALHQSPVDDLAIADLKSRKLVIADEIFHNRRLVERFGKLSES
ncbi:MAG: YdcH family protein [Bradyrhizobium sp.]